jgi:Novel STAND NTPase 1
MTTNDSRAGLHLDEDNPWPGLASYDEASQRFFYGRERDSAELLRLIRLSPLVALYGKSGLGKSSMLQAGVFPQLRLERFLPVHLRLDYSEGSRQTALEQAAARLREEIDAFGHDAPSPESAEGLWAYLQRRDRPIWSHDNFPLTPVLVFDQFEEVFSRGGSKEHVKAVLDGIADLVADRLPPTLAQDREATRNLNLQSQQYHVVLSFRSDFLAEVESWEKRAFLPRREYLHLVAMSRERAIEAVDCAGAAVLAPRMGAQIVDFLLEQEDRQSPARVTDIEPVLLSLCCYQLNLRRQPGTKIDAALLDTVGKGILKGFYEEALKGEDKRVSKFIEDNLIQGDRYRSSYPRDGALGSGELTQEELTRLEQRRLLRIDPQGGEPRIELIHDRLVSVVREARDLRRDEERRLREQEESEKRVKEALAAEQLANSESERRRLIRWRAALVLAVLLMAAALVTAGYFWNQARMESRNVIAERKALEETAVLLNSDLAAAKEMVAKTEAELASVERSLAELQVLRAAESGGTTNRANVDSARARLDSAKAKQEEIQQKKLETREAKSAGRLDVYGWRLSSGGCPKGPISVSGTARFSVEPRGNDVLVSEGFRGDGNGYEVALSSSATFPRLPPSASPNQRYYDLNTRVEWKRDGKAEFSTKGIDRVYVDENGSPARASLIKISTDCGGS